MGAKRSRTKQRLVDPEQTRLVTQELRGLSSRIGGLGRDAQLQAIAGQTDFGLTPFQEEGIQTQLSAVGLGREQAQRQIQETARTQATARGLFSSRGAIEQEAAGLAQIPLQEAAQRAQVLQQAGALQQQAQQFGQQRQLQALGMLSQQDLQRLQLQLQALGAAGGLAGRVLTSTKGGTPGVGGLVGGIAGGLLAGPAGATVGMQTGSGI